MSTHIYPDGGISYDYAVNGDHRELGIVSASPIRKVRPAKRPAVLTVARVTFRSHRASINALSGGIVIAWNELGRTWRVFIPKTESRATILGDLNQFQALRTIQRSSAP